MHYIRPVWLTHSGEKKDFEVYSCHVSPDGTRLVTAAGGGNLRSPRLARLVGLCALTDDCSPSAQMVMFVFGLLTPSTMLAIPITLNHDSWLR